MKNKMESTLEDKRIEILEDRLNTLEPRMTKIEIAQGETTARLTSIEEKIDRLIHIDTKLEARFQEKEACRMVRENVKSDMNNVGEKCRENKEEIKGVSDALTTHTMYHWKKSDRFVTWIGTALISIYILGKLTKIF